MMKTKGSSLVLYVDGEEIEEVASDIPESALYGVLEVCGNCCEVSLRQNATCNGYGHQSAEQLRKEVARLHERVDMLVQENHRLQRRLQHSSSEAREEVSQLQLRVSALAHENQQLQKELQQNAGATSSTSDISFWVVKRSEVKTTDQILGEGGWGKVVVSWFRGQQVAVKQLHPLIVSPLYKSMVRREISIMARTRHPNLVLFISAVLDQSSGPMIVTELLSISLRKAYENGRLSGNLVRLSIMMDVASALNYLHNHHEPIIHRDVNSANVLLEARPEDSWRAKLSDFGSANLARLATTPGPGAIVYAAPEVFKHDQHQQTSKVDVYSYGILLCEVLTNQFPLQDAFAGMLSAVRGTSWITHQLISSCISHESGMRPDMSDVLDVLRGCLKQL